MIFKPKIKKVLQYLSLSVIALTVALSINTIQAHAYDFSGWAKSIVDSQGADGTASVGSVPYGISTSKTGYLCYLLDKNGNAVPGTDAIALSSSGFSFYPGSREWIAESRLGGYVAGQFNGIADWSCTPWTSAGNDSYPTNEPTIRAWFEKMDGDVQNAIDFVLTNWKNPDIARKFRDGEYFLVVETLMHFQYSEKSSGGVTRTAEEVYKSLRKQYSEMPAVAMISQAPSTVQDAWYAGSLSENQLRKELLAALKNLYEKDPSSFEKREPEGWNPIGPCKLIGTPANMIKYRNTVLKSNTNVFNKFTHKIACFAEYIQPGNIGEQIGFTAWNGSTSSQLTDQQVQDYGVAMMVISADNPVQTTADEPKIPTPHPAPVESNGNFSIIKNYRTKDTTTNTLTDDGCFTTSNLGNQITIENERDYQVVGWATSSSTSTIDSITWSVPSPITQGTTPTTVTLEGTEKSLYLLLEKTEEEPPEVEDYNYKLTQSSITRRVNFTTPDHRLSMPHIENHNFKWIIPAHQTSCPGHTFTDACHGQHIGPHTEDCPEACSSTCTKAHTHNTEGCQDPHYYDCGTRCTTQTAYCSGWQSI